MKMVNVEPVIERLKVMADAAEKSAQKSQNESIGGICAKEVMKSGVGALMAAVDVLNEQPEAEVIPIETISGFLAGNCTPPNIAEWVRENDCSMPSLDVRRTLWIAFIRELAAFQHQAASKGGQHAVQ